MKKIWIDISTPPQVLFLRPIITALQAKGYDLIITTRNSTETVPLADKYKIPHVAIGSHGGKTMSGKSAAILLRAFQLFKYIWNKDIALAVSHASFSQSIAARIKRIPIVTFDDYEGNPALHILCRVADKIYVPEIFKNENLYRFGATEEKIEKFAGLKENVYLADFSPDPEFLLKNGIPSEKVLVTMRPPNLVAAYHRFENPLFDKLLRYVLDNKNTFVVLLPRGKEQLQYYKKFEHPNLLVPTQVLDGPNLLYYSDLVLGAGGTMNREASVLGTPVYTLFKGEMGSVDQNLIRMSKMFRVMDESGFTQIKFEKRQNRDTLNLQQNELLVEEVVQKILA
ncbi:MAG: DUF354 domain-containing protein [Calditrichaeota bacterium]|nr:MAG: DUF354 domain-containing protein [Calditrichota bacterium]